MININRSIDLTLQKEGGYTNNVNDSGNFLCVCNGKFFAPLLINNKITCNDGCIKVNVGTKYGISAFTLANYRNRVVTENDMRNLSKEEAIEIYKNKYLSSLKNIEQLKFQLLADFCFDIYINSPYYLEKWLLEGLKTLSFNVNLRLKDGSLFKFISEKLTLNQEKDLFLFLINRRKLFYKKIVQANSSQSVFLKGWLNRVNFYEDLYKKENKV